MTHRSKTILGIVAACAVALGLGTASEAQGDTALAWDNGAAIKSIQTDSTGAITSIAYSINNSNRTVKGCGAKLQALPHLLDSMRAAKTVDLAHQDNCLKNVSAKK
jgi:hypothetical protein